jgi:hypothetical protein
MKPLQHAQITARRYGGRWQDWIGIHNWIDRSKALFPGMRHRMFLHSDFGEWLTVRIHGDAIEAEDGTTVTTPDLFRDHQVEDLGRVVKLSEWLREIDATHWTRRRKPPRQLERIREEPAEGLAARWGGVPADYLELINFFDKPRELAPDNPEAAVMITHNSFGIFLAEDLLGMVITLTEAKDSRRPPRIISTRSAAEELVHARIGSIPPAGNLAAHGKSNLWMFGSEVRSALRSRSKNERETAKQG